MKKFEKIGKGVFCFAAAKKWGVLTYEISEKSWKS